MADDINRNAAPRRPATYWIVTHKRYRQHLSIETAITERDRLEDKTGKKFHIIRCKGYLRQTNGNELIGNLETALRGLVGYAAFVDTPDAKQAFDQAAGMLTFMDELRSSELRSEKGKTHD